VHRAGDVVLIVIGVDKDEDGDDGENEQQYAAAEGVEQLSNSLGHGCLSLS